MNLQITQELIIPSNEIKWRFSRSSGPGGQNVNKIESQVEIIFNILKSKTLSPYQKSLLLQKFNNTSFNGCISIKVQEKRSQLQNRQIAIKRLSTVIKDIILSKKKVRKVTTPTKLSQKKRIESKKRRGKIKLSRKNKLEQDL